jgi:pyruvate,orthophosphate dikinase
MTHDVARGLGDRGADLFARQTLAQLATTYGTTVLGIGAGHFERDSGAVPTTGDADSAGAELLDVLRELGGEELPQDAMTQLRRAIDAVVRACLRADPRQPPSDSRPEVALTVEQLVSGTRGSRSGGGLAFSRNPATGGPGVHGDYHRSRTVEDGGATRPGRTLPLAELLREEPALHAELSSCLGRLERHLRDLAEADFIIEEGRLWITDARPARRSGTAAFRVAVSLVDLGLIDLDEALVRVDGKQLETLLLPALRLGDRDTALLQGVAASPGAVVGQLAIDGRTALAWAALGLPVVLALQDDDSDDVAVLEAAKAIITVSGGLGSRAALAARRLGRPCVTGLRAMTLDPAQRAVILPDGTRLGEGSVLAVDGGTGEVFDGARPTEPSAVAAALPGGRPPSPHRDPTVTAALRLLAHADMTRHLRVLANAETPEEARIARRLGAEGIGLCRTEHMLLGPRRELVERIVTGEERDGALSAIRSQARAGFTAILEAMDGLPVVVRLLDPPLHEFLPDLVDLSVRTALAEERGHVDEQLTRRLRAVRRWRETNPMMGLRGVRILTVLPQIVDAQVGALAEATLALRARGLSPRPQIMIPLVADVAELAAARSRVESIVAEVAEQHGTDLAVPVGVMIELPRAALTASAMARSADFFSFGTNDLTQSSWGISHDDAEASFLKAYRQAGILRDDPFDTLDEEGVGRLVRLAAVEGRATKPELGLGACGKHAEDPASVGFFARAGLDYLSCPPHRIPVVRLEAGRQALLGGGRESPTDASFDAPGRNPS